MIANATELQVAFATDASTPGVDTLVYMEHEDLLQFRIDRLRALLDSEPYNGNKAALGRALGFFDGAYIRQMLDGVRPITEKTVALIESMDNMRGWFTPPPVGEPLILTPDERDIILAHRAVKAKANPYIKSDDKSGQRKNKEHAQQPKKGSR